MTQSKVHDTHDHDTYRNLYSAIQQQMRLDAMLSRQIQAEEQKGLAQHIKQIENKRSHKYQHNQSRDQIIPDSPSHSRYNDAKNQESIIVKIGLKSKIHRIQKQGNLNTSRVAGYYNNTHTRVTFEDPSSNQTSEDETSLLNQRFQNYDQVPSLTPVSYL